MGKVIKVSGPLVVADGMADANMADVVRVGPKQLIGEILNMTGDRASIQVYEETSGLGPGAEVVTTGAPLSVELGPGLIESIYDGIQRPLEEIRSMAGAHIPRGIQAPPLPEDKKWDFTPVAKPGDAVVLMGHGNDRGPGDLPLAATAAAFHKADPHVWLATVEGSNSFDNVLPKLKASGAKRVWLQPFMIVAGDHANNDLAGPEEDSWASRIKAAGMTPMPNLKGLGQLKGIQDIFLSHTQNAVVDLANTKKAD